MSEHHAWKHLKTITRHRREVRRLCFKIGLYKQGLTHDLSKYSPSEFLPGCRYYQGFRSPNDEERQQTGYSSAWLHHKGRNRHHYEYWVDYPDKERGDVQAVDTDRHYQAVEMPVRYVAEMFCDRVAASKIYKGDAYTTADPLAYQDRMHGHAFMHPNTEALITEMLTILKEQGEDAACAYIRTLLKEEKEHE